MTEETAAPEEGQAATPESAEAAPQSWVDSLSDDHRAYVETKGFKEPSAVLDSYRNLEKLRGVPEDQLLKLPSDMKAEGALDSVYDRLGRPESAEAYTRTLDDSFNGDAYKAIAAEAYKRGMNDDQFAGMQTAVQNISVEMEQAREAQAAEAFDAWKSSNEQDFQNAAKVMSNVGVTEDQLAGILAGDKVEMYGFLAKVASRSSEGDVVMGDPAPKGFEMTAAQAQAKKEELLADESFMGRYMNSSQKIRASAVEEMEKLSKIIAGSRG